MKNNETISAGNIYRHFKGNFYEVIGIAKHSETLEGMVVYKALYGEGQTYVRPAGMWNETVIRDGCQMKRFTPVSELDEAIRCAAIKYYLPGDNEPHYVTGYNHGQCVEMFSVMDLRTKDRDMSREVQGFMTTLGRFVDREDAYHIAKAAKQLKFENPTAVTASLISENVNYKNPED